MRKIFVVAAMGLLVLTACVTTDQGSPARPGFTPFPQATATAIRILPTASSPRDAVLWNHLEVSMDRLEITQDYVTDYGSSRLPTEGNKFLWVHLQLRNSGTVEQDVPASEHFSILYAAIELKPTYGHRADYTDYTTLGPVIFPDQESDGWLRFDIPATAELKDLRFVFLPESSQVGTSYNSPNYPYADDKPTYVWKCGL